MMIFLRTILLSVLPLVVVSVLNAQASMGVRIGPPPPTPVLNVMPQRPDLKFVWVRGYWYPVRRHYRWHEGYWTEPPYEGACWVAPRHDGERFFVGYWDGDRGPVAHDHRWDHLRGRDFRYQDRD
jgi:hypothetical protein